MTENIAWAGLGFFAAIGLIVIFALIYARPFINGFVSLRGAAKEINRLDEEELLKRTKSNEESLRAYLASREAMEDEF